MIGDWRIPEKMQIPIKADEDGFTGRECPDEKCKGYFKVEFGTGLPDEDLPCHCPYCGHVADHAQFWTEEQIEYAKSVALRQINDSLRHELRKLEFDHPAQGPFGIGISMKLKPSSPLPIRHYREKQLETEVVCQQCTLHYAIYGVFAYCPDCGLHNSPQILSKNLDLTIKELALVNQVESKDLADHLVADALENVVSAFDGFGREITRVSSRNASDPGRAENLSFQNLTRVKGQLHTLFGFDLCGGVSTEDWQLAVRSFNKRHLLAHKMGVVDRKYIDATSDSSAVVGRRVVITVGEVRELVDVIRTLGDTLMQEVSKA